MENNKVLLLGKVVGVPRLIHEVDGEKFYEFGLEVKRLSGSVDNIPIIFSERLLMLENLIEGKIVKLNGQFRSYNNPEGEKSKLVLRVFASKITITDAAKEEDKNVIYLEGFVCKKPNYRKTPFGREISDLLIRVSRSYKKCDYIPCIAWGRYAKYSESFNVGDEVIISGRIGSREYEKQLDDGVTKKKVAYEVTISKLEKVSEAKEQEDELKIKYGEDLEEYIKRLSARIRKNEESIKKRVREQRQNDFKYCRNCGNRLPSISNYCNMCGECTRY